MEGLLDIEPKQYLEFVRDDAKILHTTLVLNNLQDCKVAYNIKTTSPKLFIAKPNIGIIDPKRSVTIHISSIKPIKDDEKLAHFQVNASKCFEQYDPKTFWKQIDSSQIQQTKLKSKVQQGVDVIINYQEKIKNLEKELTDWRQASQTMIEQLSKMETQDQVMQIVISAFGVLLKQDQDIIQFSSDEDEMK